MRGLVYSIVLSLSLINLGCGGPRPLSDLEKNWYGQASISAAKIQDLDGEYFIVVNPTRIAGWEESKGFEKLNPASIREIPLDFFWAYTTPAIRHCSSRMQYQSPQRGELYGSHARKYRCISYEDWAFEWLQESGLGAGGLCGVVPGGRLDHPCKQLAGTRFEFTKEQCDTYSKLLRTSLHESIPCADMQRRIDQRGMIFKSPTRKEIPISIDAAKRQCGELGFVSQTEKFGECVLRLTK